MSDGGRVLIVGVPALELDAASRDVLEAVRPAGVILFGWNVESAPQLRALVSDVRSAAPDTLLFVDAEGGRVDRLRSLVGPAPAGEVLAGRPPRASERAGRWVGHAVRSFGFDADFAPMVDLDRGRSSNALDGRYLGSAPRSVTARARAFLRGLHGAGVAGCLKHFPGLGGAGEDTHDEPSRIDLGPSELAPDLEPYRRAHEEAEMVMMSHASYPGLEPSGRPASLSSAVIDRLLRDDLGFRGLVVSDDLDMRALEPFGSLADRAVLALEAGCDAIPVCRSTGEAVAVAERLASPAFRSRLRSASARWDELRRRVRELQASAPSYAEATIRRRLAELTSTAS